MVTESYLNDFEVQPKHSSLEVLAKWRKLCVVVKNPKRRFRYTANLSKRYEAAAMRHTNQENLRFVRTFKNHMQGVQPSDYTVPVEVKAAGFQISADELGSIVEDRDITKLEFHGGVAGIAEKLSTSTTNGLTTDSDLLNRRQEIYGINKFTESEGRNFLVFVWEALQDMTLMILGVCAFVSLIVGIAMEGWPKGAHDGLGILAGILLVVFVMATSDYRQSFKFKDFNTEREKIAIQVTRNGYWEKMSICDLLPGDIVHLAIGDQVPADGLFVSRFSVLIDESSLTGESEPVMVSTENPYLLSGTKVQGGSCKMLVTTVGMRTHWGKLMATLSEARDDKIPLHFKDLDKEKKKILLSLVLICLNLVRGTALEYVVRQQTILEQRMDFWFLLFSIMRMATVESVYTEQQVKMLTGVLKFMVDATAMGLLSHNCGQLLKFTLGYVQYISSALLGHQLSDQYVLCLKIAITYAAKLLNLVRGDVSEASAPPSDTFDVADNLFDLITSIEFFLGTGYAASLVAAVKPRLPDLILALGSMMWKFFGQDDRDWGTLILASLQGVIL